MNNILFPYGTIIAYSANIDPQTYLNQELNFSPTIQNNTGWIVCDGSNIDIAVFPQLYEAIGNLYGGNGGRWGNNFNLPDYRGYFLRGLAINNQQDPGYNSRTGPYNGTRSGVGSAQLPMVQLHEHSYTSTQSYESMGGNGGPPISQTHQNQVNTLGLYSDDSGRNSLSGEETRPKNIYVNYLIYSGLPATA